MLFEHYHANFPFGDDYCFITIIFKEYVYDFQKQLNEIYRLMHSFPFCFIASMEFCLAKAGGWHFHIMTHKQNLPLIGELCEYHLEPPKWDDCLERALTYLCKEDVKECTAQDFSRSSKRYFQKNDSNTEFLRVLKGEKKLELISVQQQIELIPPTAILVPQQIELTPPTAILVTKQIEITPETTTLGQSLETVESRTGTINWDFYFRPIKRFFWQLFIRKNKTFFTAKDDNQRENNSIARWNDDS